MTQRIPLEGVDNFRDFGGYPATGGRRLKRGRLYRSASHGRATDADLEVIAGLNITTIVDLRRKGERLRDPSRRHPGFAAEVIDNDLGNDQEDEWLAHLRTSDLTEASFRDYLLRYYDKAPGDPRHVDLFARFFQAVAASDGAVLIHCAAGKDRTGLVAAMLLSLLGVPDEYIAADYAKTAEGMIKMRAAWAAWAAEQGDEATEKMSEAPAHYFESPPEVMSELLAELRAQHGSVLDYLRSLGVTDTQIAALRERLVEPAA